MRQGIYIAMISILTLLGCARQTSPTGGPKDETPPQLISSNPPDKTVNYKGNEITLQFDEDIQLNNAREQLIITPSINKKFEATAKKKKVIIKLTEPLNDSTTYTFNFRESIQDLNEKNPAVNLQLALSTGTYIDSLSIQGIVQDRLTNLPQKNQTVALVQISDTTNIFKHPAQWLTIADEDGNFHLQNLKPGRYILYAFNDKNKNLIVDSKTESYGYYQDTLNLTESISEVELYTFKLDIRDFELISARPAATTFRIKFNKGIENFTLSYETGAEPITQRLENSSTINVYNTHPDLDSILVRLIASDTLQNTIDTSFYAQFNKDQRAPEKIAATMSPAQYYTSTSTLYTQVTFNKPITFLNVDSIFLQLDSIHTLPIQAQSIAFDSEKTTMTLSEVIPYDTLFPSTPALPTSESEEINAEQLMQSSSMKTVRKIILTAAPTSFISVQQDTVPRQEKQLNLVTPEQTAILHTKVETAHPFILQLLDPQYKVVSQTINATDYSFSNIKPGTYLLRLIIDENNNGKWDPGNYFQNTQPENIVFYTTDKGDRQLSLKAYWELGPLLITYE